jgi:hypothetical protein
MKRLSICLLLLSIFVATSVNAQVVMIASPPHPGGSITGVVPTGTGFTHNSAGVQDAASATIDSTFVFGSGQLGRAAISGDGIIPLGSNSFTLSNVPSGVTFPGYGHYTLTSAPSTPSAGFANCWFDTTSVNFVCKDSSARVPHLIRSFTCTTGNWVSVINDDGSVTCTQPSYSNLSGTAPALADPGSNGYVFRTSSNVTSASTTVPTTALSGTLQAAQEPAHAGDVTNSAGSLALTIAANIVSNSKLATMIAHTYKGNNTGSTATPIDVTTSQLATDIGAVTSMTGDVTGTGPGATATTIAANAVSNSKLATMGAHTHKGNNTASTGAALDLTAAQVLTDIGAVSSLTGDVTGTGPGATASTIAANAVTNAKMSTMGAHTHKGNNTGSTGAVLDLTAAQVLTDIGAVSSLTGDVTASGPGAAASTIAANAVTNAKMATMGANTVKGSVAGGTPADLSQTQLTAMLNAATSSLQGALSAAHFTRLSTSSGLSGMAFGSNLTDASTTINPGTDKASGYLLPAATLSVNRTTTLGTSGSPPTGLTVTIFRYDLTAHTEAIVNGGSGGGTLCTFPVSPTLPQACSATWDGTDWGSAVFYYLGF